MASITWLAEPKAAVIGRHLEEQHGQHEGDGEAEAACASHDTARRFSLIAQAKAMSAMTPKADCRFCMRAPNPLSAGHDTLTANVREPPMPRIRFDFGALTLDAELLDTPTAKAIAAALPIEAQALTWGEEVYLTCRCG